MSTYIPCPNGRNAGIEICPRTKRQFNGEEFELGSNFIWLGDGPGMFRDYGISYENGMSNEEILLKMTGLIDYLMKVITKRGFAPEFKKRLNDDKWGTHYDVYFDGNYNVSHLEFMADDFERHHFSLTKPNLTFKYDQTKGDL